MTQVEINAKRRRAVDAWIRARHAILEAWRAEMERRPGSGEYRLPRNGECVPGLVEVEQRLEALGKEEDEA